MLFDGKSRSLVNCLLRKFESEYKQDWEEERFTVLPHPCQTKHGELDFDTIFFWKVYAQGYFAMQAGNFFKTLADQMGSGSAMIRHLASLAPYKDRLLPAYRGGQFASGMNEAIHAGRPGWKILGYAVTASERLVNCYYPESESYIAQWFCHCLSDRQWDGKWESLIESVNSSVRHLLILKDAHERVLQLSDFITNTFVLPPERHLAGVGPEMISFFLRDWKDFDGWRYLWKHDIRNEKFWSMVAGRPDFGLKDGQKDTVLAFLVRSLSADELDSGVLAKINAAVYRVHKDFETQVICHKLSIK